MPTTSPVIPSPCPRLLVCDLDGTLLNSHGVVTEATTAALHQAVDAGIEIAFATGRRHSFAWKVLEPVGLDGKTVLVSSNGAIISTLAGKQMHRTSMPRPTALLLCEQLDSFRDSLIFTFDGTGPGALVVEDIEALHRRIPRWVDSNRHEIRCVVPLEQVFHSGGDPIQAPIQAMICGTLRQMEEAMSVLNSTAPETIRLCENLAIQRTEYIARDLSIVDLMPAGCSKATAIARFAAERSIDAAEIACIGDNMNDADMLAFAGTAIVMENAAPQLMATAIANGWTIAGSHDEDGAAEAILDMLERTPPGDRRTRRLASCR